jgi:hypothetical protein
VGREEEEEGRGRAGPSSALAMASMKLSVALSQWWAAAQSREPRTLASGLALTEGSPMLPMLKASARSAAEPVGVPGDSGPREARQPEEGKAEGGTLQLAGAGAAMGAGACWWWCCCTAAAWWWVLPPAARAIILRTECCQMFLSLSRERGLSRKSTAPSCTARITSTVAPQSLISTTGVSSKASTKARPLISSAATTRDCWGGTGGREEGMGRRGEVSD